MKITPKAAESFLKNPASDCRAVLLYGPDGGLARERARRLKEVVLGKDHDPMALVEIEEARLSDDPALLSDELKAVSMMAPKRVILLRDADDSLTKIIKAAEEDFNQDTFLLVVAGELSTRSSLRAFFEADPACAAIACYHDEIRDVGELVRKALAAAGISAERDAVEYISQQLGNDRYVTLQELEKICVYASDTKRLSLTEAQQLVDYNRDTKLDDLVNAVADKSLAALDTMVQVQVREGTQPIAYLRALMRYFNRLYFIQAQVATGRGVDEVIASLKPKVFYKQEQSLRRHLQQWDLAKVAKALALLNAAELACKSSDIPMVAASTRRLMQVTQLR